MSSALPAPAIRRVALDVALARHRIAGRVIVGEDQSGGADLERAAHDLARIDRGFVDRAFAHHLVAEQAVLRVEEQHPQPLGRQVRHVGEQIVEQRLRIGEDRARSTTSARSDVQHHVADHAEMADAGLPGPRIAGLGVRPGGEHRRQRPEFLD